MNRIADVPFLTVHVLSSVPLKRCEMSKYSELATLAVEKARETQVHYKECEELAFALRSALIEVLEFPRENVDFVPLDESLRLTGGNEDRLRQPDFRLGDDGFFYFGLNTLLDQPHKIHFYNVSLRIGLKRIGGTVFTVRTEKDMHVDRSKPEDMARFCEYVFEDYKQFFGTPFDAQPKRLGFSAGSP